MTLIRTIISTVFVFFIAGLCLVSSEMDAANRLRRTLFSNYNVSQRPLKNQSQPVEVSMKMWIFHVEDVNDTRQIIKFHGVMQMMWRDDFLQWRPQDYNGTTYMMTNNVVVWTPRLILLNSAAPNTFHYLWNLPVKVWNTGSVYATVELTVTSTCAFDFTNYPYDVQRCPVAFYMGASVDQILFYNTLDPELRFYWRQNTKDNQGNKVTASNWEVIGTPEVQRKYYTRFGLNDTLGDMPKYAATMIMEIWITFRRRLSYFQFALVMPAILTSVLTVAALVPMETTSALGLLLLNMLAQGLFIDDLLDVVPKSIGIVPRIVQYYAINMILTVMAVFVRLLIQWSLNRHQIKNQPKSDDGDRPDHNILERIETRSCLDVFFAFATPIRLNFLFLVLYILIYVICAGLLLS